jgi:hypothetical protein
MKLVKMSYSKKYYEEHKLEIIETVSKYRKKHLRKLKKYAREYNQANKDKLKEKRQLKAEKAFKELENDELFIKKWLWGKN